MQMRKINCKKGYSGEKIDTSSPQNIFWFYDYVNFILNLNLQLIKQGNITLQRPLKVLTFANLFLFRHQRYTVVVNALQHLYMAFTSSKSQFKIILAHVNQLKITPHHIRVLQISNIFMRIFIKNIHYLAFWRGGRTSQTRNWFSTNQHPHWKVST